MFWTVETLIQNFTTSMQKDVDSFVSATPLSVVVLFKSSGHDSSDIRPLAFSFPVRITRYSVGSFDFELHGCRGFLERVLSV